jgi:hypothetical protein
MVETSVAVATPSTTALRMMNGRISAGIEIQRALAISRPVARRTDERSSSAERI